MIFLVVRAFDIGEEVPARGLETAKPSACNTGLCQSEEMSMSAHIVSLLDSLTQSTFVWNGDFNVNVSGGAVDWFGLCAVLVLWLAVRKR